MKKILLVEDDKFLVRVYSSLLRKRGYETLVLESGVRVVDMVKSEKPDLIVLDIVMPQVDGFTVLTNLRDDPETNAVPVLTLSVLQDQSDVKKMLDLGVKGHLPKTKFTFNQVVDAVEKELS